MRLSRRALLLARLLLFLVPGVLGEAPSLLAQDLAVTTAPTPAQAPPPSYAPYGGTHELNGYIAHSWHAGPALGFVRNTTFTTVVGRYSYRLHDGNIWNLRWSPEVTLLADLHEQAPSPNDIDSAVPVSSYGGGITPLAFQGVYLPHRRIQPFINIDGGMLFYNRRVLSDGGTYFMFTIDYGAGVNVFVSRRNAVNVGFRYQHQSNADIGEHNPGTDAELFCFGFSHFFEKRARH